MGLRLLRVGLLRRRGVDVDEHVVGADVGGLLAEHVDVTLRGEVLRLAGLAGEVDDDDLHGARLGERVDDAGHELRTPITVIRGHLELMDDDPESSQATLRIVTTELDRMGRIVTDLLALAKADRPDFVRASEDVDTSMLTVALEAKISALADRRWRVARIAEGTARLDAQRITQAVLQLAQNAVQHTRDGDAITLASDIVDDPELGRALTISVEDTGPGVPHAEREHIFERFSHGEPPDGRRHSGAGLGLAIVRAIAEGHHGRVDVGGEPGQGAVFTLVLPVDTPLPDPTDTEEP